MLWLVAFDVRVDGVQRERDVALLHFHCENIFANHWQKLRETRFREVPEKMSNWIQVDTDWIRINGHFGVLV